MRRAGSAQFLFAVGVAGAAFAVAVIPLVLGLRTPATFIPAAEATSAPLPPQPVRAAPLPVATDQAAPVREIPREIKAIYLTSWSAATRSRLLEAIHLVQTTDLNGIVIDVKDYTGKVAFKASSPLIKDIGSAEPRLGDLSQTVGRLHQTGIHVIARIAVFQDQHLIKVRPDLAVEDAQGNIWRDRIGLGWVDPASPEVWAYTIEIAREAAKAGVDELNFDYIRFPTDGKLSGLRYPVFDENRESNAR